MKRPIAIKEGDVIRVTRPIFVTRVGYPKTVKDYLTQEVMRAAEEFVRKFNPKVHIARSRIFGVDDITTQDMNRSTALIAREIAYVLAKKDGFGGRQRKLFTVKVPEAKGQEFYVDGVRTAKTGTYFPPCPTTDWESGYKEWEPGGLEDLKTHRLLRISTPFATTELRPFGEYLEIERKNVEFVKRLTSEVTLGR